MKDEISKIRSPKTNKIGCQPPVEPSGVSLFLKGHIDSKQKYWNEWSEREACFAS